MSDAVISARTVRGLLSTDQITMSGSGKVKMMRRIPLESYRVGVFAPTETIRGGINGWLFDSQNEQMTLLFCVPLNWDQESDIVLAIYCVLEAAEAVDDKIDWATSVISVADHEDVDVAPTQTPGVEHDIDDNNAAGDLHRVGITLDYDDGTCPIATADSVSIVLNRTANVGGAGYVAGVVVIHMCVEYQIDRMGVAV